VTEENEGKEERKTDLTTERTEKEEGLEDGLGGTAVEPLMHTDEH
jgi:hypothetical protein